MATKTALRLPVWVASHNTASAVSATARRTYTSSHRPANPCALIRSSLRKTELQQSFRRSYADQISPVTKRRGRGFFKWTWRLTYLSAIGGLAYLSYNIYSLRTPQEQFEPDPAKKTLVVLGTYNNRAGRTAADTFQVPAGAQSRF